MTCNTCKFIFWNNPRPVVSGLIIHNEKVLLIKRGGQTYNNYWSLPGGIIDFLESPEDALRREIYEETQVNIEKYRLIDAYLIIYNPNGLEKLPSHTSIDLVYRCSMRSKDQFKKTEPEVLDIGLFPTDDLPNKIAFKHREMIIKHFKL